MTADPDPIQAHVSIEDEMRRSYLDYAMSVIIGRALPDARDGFKAGSSACSVRDAHDGAFTNASLS